MLIGRTLILALPLNNAIYFTRRYFTLLLEAVRNHDCVSLMKEVQHSIMNSLEAGSKLVNAVSEVICLRPAKFVPQRFQSLEPR